MSKFIFAVFPCKWFIRSNSLVNPDKGTCLNDFGENGCIQRANSLYIYWVLREWLSVWIYVGYQPDWSQLDIRPNHQNHLFWRPIEF